jgi:hypothetical protein
MFDMSIRIIELLINIFYLELTSIMTKLVFKHIY